MTKSQYKRLCLVLLLPLLFAGLVIAEKEMLIDNHFISSCFDDVTHFTCTTIPTSRQIRHRTVMRGGMFLRSAKVAGFSEIVIPSGTSQARRLTADLRQPPSIADISAAMGIQGHCDLDVLLGRPGEWSLDCGGRPGTFFRFADEQVQQKYADAIASIRAGEAEYTQRGKLAYIVALLLPLLAFLALSAVGWLASYVRHGRQGAPAA